MQLLSRLNNKAFTLLELLIVISIVGVITAASVVPYNSFIKRSRDARRKVDIEQLRAALELYKSNNEVGLYPVQLEELATNYIQQVPTDPQGNEYDYECISECIDYSLSANLESGSVYIVQAGSVLTVIPTVVGASPTRAPTVTLPPSCKANGLVCTNNSQCCSNYCNKGTATESQVVLGIAHSRGAMLANIDDPNPPSDEGYCATHPNPGGISTPTPTGITPTARPTLVISTATPIVSEPTGTNPCKGGGTYVCSQLTCKCQHSACVSNSCVMVDGDSPSTCTSDNQCSNQQI